MKPLAKTLRCLLVAVTAMSVMASPFMAHAAAGCKNDGVKVSAHHRPDCCCDTTCHCAHCPGAGSSNHTPAPTPVVPDDGRVVVKIHTHAVLACVSYGCAPVSVVECTPHFLASANLATTLIAKHTCLRV
jgi:hypothetical protein